VTELQSSQHYRTVQGSQGLAVAWFTADWCSPCRSVKAAVEKLSEANRRVDFYRVDVDEYAEVAANAKVRSVPQFHIFKGGKLVSLVNGANAEALEDALKKNLDPQ
jgi:thioredoxin 1